MVDAEVLITDDQDGFKAVADDAGVNHQICQQHAKPNVLDFIAKAAGQVLDDPPTAPEGLDVTPDQLLEDLAALEWITLGHPGHGAKLLGEMYDRYTVLAYCTSALMHQPQRSGSGQPSGIGCATIFYVCGTTGGVTRAIVRSCIMRNSQWLRRTTALNV